ncbi:flagellin N-terminal helical domain-containing protein [Vreelandella aquamarina]|uniref:flagellin N-terminal helical domain-containing protein n=1 Tax=Vreelandella aquamarina TaxID=77097 RepID=UPI002E7BB521|nr:MULTISPECIES: flagellin [Halomonas]
MSVINTNITSMIGQQNLNKSQNALQTSMERLSSGLRINSAKDDAAGQAIANRMSAQITGLATAQRNANDGISVAQTAEGGLNQINDNLQRIRELSVQAENGTNSSQDLDSIQNEINQRLEEIDRISRETDFNGTKVLGENTDGTDPTKRTISIQVGSQDGQAIEVKLEQINRQTLGLEGFNVNGSGEVANRAADVEALVLNGFEEIGTRPNGAVEYAKTETVQNDATTVDDLLAAAGTSGATVTYTGTDNGTGTQAVNDSYTFNADTNSFSFDAADVSKTNTVGYMTQGMEAGEMRSATVTVQSTEQEITYDSEGNIFAADGETQLFLDSTGNLTQNNAGNPPAATLENLSTSMATGAGTSTTAITDGGDLTFTNGDDGGNAATQVFDFSSGLAEGDSITIQGRTLTATGAMSAAAVGAAFTSQYQSGVDATVGTAGDANSYTMTGTVTGEAVNYTVTDDGSGTVTFTNDDDVSDQSAFTASTTTLGAATGGSIEANGTTFTADTGSDAFDISNATVSADAVTRNLETQGGFVDIGDGKTYAVDSQGSVSAGVTESADVTFGAMANTETLTISDGTNTLTLTAGGALTAEEVTQAFNEYITDGSTTVANATMTEGTPGELAAFQANYSVSSSDTNSLTLSSATFNTDVADVVLGGSATGSTVDVTAGEAATTSYVDAETKGFVDEASSEVTTTYFAQENDMITDDTGAQVYQDADGKLTMDAVTEGERTVDALGQLDTALSRVDALRSDLGAIQNRMESAIENLSTTETNLSAARSRIEDADYATEVANMTRAQILQQAGTSVLAQANQIPQSVLSLLG